MGFLGRRRMKRREEEWAKRLREQEQKRKEETRRKAEFLKNLKVPKEEIVLNLNVTDPRVLNFLKGRFGKVQVGRGYQSYGITPLGTKVDKSEAAKIIKENFRKKFEQKTHKDGMIAPENYRRMLHGYKETAPRYVLFSEIQLPQGKGLRIEWIRKKRKEEEDQRGSIEGITIIRPDIAHLKKTLEERGFEALVRELKVKERDPQMFERTLKPIVDQIKDYKLVEVDKIKKKPGI